MPVQILDRGRRNVVKTPEDNGTGTIVLEGDDNIVEIGSGSMMEGGWVRLGSSCRFTVGDRCRLKCIDVFTNINAEIVIGSGSNFTWKTRLYAHEPGRVVIGADCLIASETFLTNSDMHPIFDLDSGVRLNPPEDVGIGDHVWLAEGVRLHKGAYVGAGSIIGACAMVTSRLPENVLAAGIPARILRERVSWTP
jgi:acetyltransferase-like isoleucine patch superfamily enzyme